MAQSGQEVPQTVNFLREDTTVPQHLATASTFNSLLLRQAVRLNCSRLLKTSATKLQTLTQSMGLEDAWNQSSLELVEVAKAFSFYMTVDLFTDALTKRKWEVTAKTAMSHLGEFYTVNGILNESGTYLQMGMLTPEQISILESQRIQLMSVLRPNAVALVDGFDYPDRLLNSCLGRYDGQVYDALYEYAKNSSLNKEQVHPSFHKYVKPMRDALKAKL